MAAMRKKLADLTPIERMNRIMKHSTWEDAEECGMEILARCLAKKIYVDDINEDDVSKMMEKLCARADEWAKENSYALALARVAKRSKNRKEKKLCF